jgi:glycosyltransferase involved in cell wall biosynthesis
MINNKYYNILFCSIKQFYYFVFEYIFLRIIRLIHFLFKDYSVNSDKPLVSIIIATYNRSDILVNRTLPSILSQTYKNIEVVIIGDKCIDNTPKILANFSDKRVKFYDLKKRGKYPQHIKDRWFVQGSVPRNFGMKIAKGDWFIFISDDDILYPDHVDTLLKNALELNVEFLSASYETIKNGIKIIVDPVDFGFGNNIKKIGGMQTWIYKSYLKFFKWNKDSWRKSWNRPVDYDLQLRFINSGVKIGHINNIVYFNPPVEGTDTTGYEAALIADKLN